MASSSIENSKNNRKLVAPYGSWKSPITADMVSSSGKRLEGFALHSSNAHAQLIWLESRPSESGRTVLVLGPDSPGNEPVDMTPEDFSIRTTAQEYGGGAFSISGDLLIFSNDEDQRLYKQFIGSKDSKPMPVTPDYGGPVARYADGSFDARFNRYVAVREDHRGNSPHPTTDVVSICFHDETIKEPEVLVSGSDFYAFPRICPQGKRLAWVEWSHPHMHWDKAQLWVGYISEKGDINKRICIAGGDPSVLESPSEPKWSFEGNLYFVTDRNTGFWNIYKWVEEKNQILSMYHLDAEFTRPLWVYGSSSYDFLQKSDQSLLIACSYRKNGRSYLGLIDQAEGSLSVLDIPFTHIMNIISGHSCIYVEGSSAVHPPALAKVVLDEGKSKAIHFEIIWSSSLDFGNYGDYFSLPELIEFPTQVDGQKAYAYFYPPSNPNYCATEEEKPPLLLESHGGPTAEANGSLNLGIQYSTSRGWAFVDVNYGGSTGYGREYRERLLGSWGIVDVNDCCNCAEFLVEKGKVDRERLCITGCSAGGYTTLSSLAFRDTFKAGASLFGIADLASLRAEMHKFESHYITNLVGSEAAFYERSSINFVEKFSCPIILFQGLADTIVHPEQARNIFHALKEKGLPVVLIEYEGEPHGFRKAENIKSTLEQQILFFARTIGHFKVADEVTPVHIENFD